MHKPQQLFGKCEYTTAAMKYDWFTAQIRFLLNLLRSYTAIEFSDLSVGPAANWSTSNWEEFLNTGELFSSDISDYLMFSIHFSILPRNFISMIWSFKHRMTNILSLLRYQHHTITSSTTTEPLLHQSMMSWTWRDPAISLLRQLQWQTRIPRPQQHYHQETWTAGRHSRKWFCSRWWGDRLRRRWGWGWRRARRRRCCGQATWSKLCCAWNHQWLGRHKIAAFRRASRVQLNLKSEAIR